MKRIMMVFTALFLALCCLTGCGGGEAARTKKLRIVATVFPAFDWTREILGEKADGAELSFLTDGGADLHSYQPTAEDMLKISNADVCIYIGGESDKWVEDALGKAAKKEETVEGMEAEEEEAEDYDEHVWLSLRNARALCAAIADALAEADPGNGITYWMNETAYDEKLSALDARYGDMVRASGKKTLLFGDRFPFRYLADDYGLAYYAAFPGCSAETEASFETVAFLAGKADELGLGSVLVLENADGRIAHAIVQNTQAKNQRILELDSMQSASPAEGNTYLSRMEKNLDVLRDALD